MTALTLPTRATRRAEVTTTKLSDAKRARGGCLEPAYRSDQAFSAFTTPTGQLIPLGPMLQ